MNSNLYLLDLDKTTVGVLSNRMPFSLPFFDDLQERSLDDLTDVLTLSVPASHPQSEMISIDRFILYPTLDEGYKLYKIKEITETSDDNGYMKELYCEISAQDDLIKTVVKPTSFESAHLEEVLEYTLAGSGFSVGQVDDLGEMDYKIEDYTNSLEATISAILAFGGEVEYEYEMLPDSTTIVGQSVSAFAKTGEETGLFFTHGKDVKGVERIEDTSQLVTALVGVGKANEAGVPLSFESHTATPPKNYERGADWLGSVTALETYSDGQHIMGVFKDDNAQSPAELYRNTLEALKKYSKPLMTYKVSLILLEKLTGYEHMMVRIGDTIVVQDETVNPPLYVKARVRKLSRSITNPINDAVELGDYIPVVPPVNKQLAKLQSKIRAKEETWNKAEEIPAIQEKLEQVPTKDDLFSTPNQRLKVRYIRDYINGNTANGSNHWVELQVLKQGQNIAKGIIPTGSTALTDPAYLTDGIVDSSRFVGASGGLQYVQLDLGSAVTDIEYLHVWHYYNDARAYNQHYVDISEDGLLWIRMYNSDKGGTVTETEKGHIIPINSSAIISHQNDTVTEIVKDVTNLEDFKQSAEAQLEQKVDVNAYNERVQELSQDIADKAGLEYVNGHLISKADAQDVDALTAEVAKKAGLEYVDGQLKGKASTTSVSDLTAEVGKKAGLEYVDGKLVAKADKATTYSKTEVDNAVNGKVSKTEYNTDQAGIVERLDNQSTAIEQNESDISLKASQSTVDTLAGRVTDAESSLSVQANQIATKVSQTEVDKSIDAIKVGGRNLLKEGSKQVTGSREFVSFADLAPIFDEHGLVEYSISFDIKSADTSKTDKIQVYMQNGSGSRYSFSKSVSVTEDFTRVSVTVTPKESNMSLTQSMLAFYGQYDTGNIPTVKNVMVELGNKPSSSFVPAPEELEERVTNAETSITQTKDAIELKADQSTVETLEETVAGKADSSAVSGLSTRVSTAEGKITANATAITQRVAKTDYATDQKGVTTRLDSAEASIQTQADQIALKAEKASVDTLAGRVSKAESSLTVQADQISTKVGQTEVNKSIATSKEIKDTRDKNETPKYYWDNYKKQTVEEFKRRSALGVTGGAVYGQLATIVAWSDVSGGAIIQRFSSSDGLFERKSLSDLVWGDWLQIEDKASAIARANTAETNAKSYADSKVNPVVTRVTNAETAITQNKNAIALKASQSDVSTIKTDLGNAVTRLSKAESSLSVQANQIATKVTQTEVNNSINAIQVGGRNLLKNTKNVYQNITVGVFNAMLNESRLNTLDYYGLTIGDTVTYRVKMNVLGDYPVAVRASIYKEDNSYSALIGNYVNAKEEGYSYLTFTVPQDIVKIWFGFQNGYAGKDVTIPIQYTQPKVEKGNKYTDWTPAPEDIENRMTTAESTITQTADTLKTKITKDEAKAIAKAENNLGFRFIRYIGDGNTRNTETHIVEMAVIDENGVNVAKGILPTSGATDATGLAYITDGATSNTNAWGGLGKSLETQWMMLDLGKSYSNIDAIKLWHFYGDVRQYSYKLQVSEDGINWIGMYDTAVNGLYNATSAGFEIFINQQKAIYAFASEFTQTAESLSLKADSDTVDDLGNRLESAEELITPEAIVSTVTSSEEYVGAMEEKANATDLDGKVNVDDLDAVKGDLETNYATKAEVTQTSTDIDFKFQSAGGVNLIKNSVGYAGKDFWSVSGLVDTGQPVELEQRGAGSGFYMKGGTLKQTVSVKGGSYVVSAIVKKDATGTGYLRASYDNDQTTEITFQAGTEIDFEAVNFLIEVEGTQIDIELQGTADSGLIFTSLMLNVGTLPLQWSHSTGEVYSTNIQFNENGITVKSSEYDGFTSITPEKFAGYYNSTGDEGQYEEVFSLNKDTTVVNKLDAKQEINMSPVKIVPIQSGTLNGWAFVASDE